MGIKYGMGRGGARISLSQGSVLSREYFPSSLNMIHSWHAENGMAFCIISVMLEINRSCCHSSFCVQLMDILC